MDERMRFEATLTAEADAVSSEHLLQHFSRGNLQEDLCFALWRPSTGAHRYTALISEILLPHDGERNLHGNASFNPSYLARAVTCARAESAGLAFMHSHPGAGWQGMSPADVTAERDVIAYPAGATGLPLLGLTIGSDGFWSSRFWERDNGDMQHRWCQKTKVLGPNSYKFYFNDETTPPAPRRDILRRTFNSWGAESQNTISRLRIGIVGLGSVGCIVAEALARIGISQVILIDPDHVEEHNLDRLLYGTVHDIGKLKVELAAEAMRAHATAEQIEITALPASIHDAGAYQAVLDCDVIFSCVDRPIARDALNFVAQSHLIPVIDGGVAVETDRERDRLFSAHWRAHIVTPYRRCMRCSRQYNTSMVTMELDGSLDDPSYVRNLPPEEQLGNLNVFPFSLAVAGMEVNLMLRYLIAADWWPAVSQQDYQFITGETLVENEGCLPYCPFRQRYAQGDLESPFYLRQSDGGQPSVERSNILKRLIKFFGRLFSTS